MVLCQYVAILILLLCSNVGILYCVRVYHWDTILKHMLLHYLLAALVVVNAFAGLLPWKYQSDFTLPPNIQIWTLHTAASPFGTKLTGAYMRFDMADPDYQFVVKDSNSDFLGYFPKTPIQYAQEEQNIVYSAINGGFFDMTKNVSASFLAESYLVRSANTLNEATNKHPTISAFGLNEGTYTADYIYSYNASLSTYAFKLPNMVPGPAPNADSGRYWNVSEGIGAGPMLLKQGQRILGNPQNFNTNIMNVRHPRSAICIGFDGYLYFLAIDGRYADSDGLNITQLADVMADLNCKDAINLDGGGSTLLYGSNKVLNRPSDPTGPRPVVSAILLRDKKKKKLSYHLDKLRQYKEEVIKIIDAAFFNNI